MLSIPVLILRSKYVGKTNHGSTKLYGRAIRSKDVRSCGVGAYAFYLAVRFFMTEEYKTVPDDYFCTNQNWFDTKLLVDCYAADLTKEMSNDSYSKFLKKILSKLGIASNHIVHLGRVLGSAELELLENEREGTLDMGNWSADVHKRSYSIKMPIKSLRKAGGFVLADGMHHNTRTTVEPDDEALLIGVFPFVRRCLEAVREAKREAEASKAQNYLNTALAFLEMLDHLALVFLQDAAAMLVLHPERKEMAMYKHIGVLKSNMFALYVEKMRFALVSKDVPTDYHLEVALPGVQQHLQMLEIGQGKLARRIDRVEMNTVKMIQEEGEKTRATIANGLEAAALAMRGSGGQSSYKAQLNRLRTRTSDSDGGLLALADHQFYATHKSVQSFYNEYYGLGDFKDIPVDGGLATLEEKYKAKWRKHIKGGAKHISRVKQVMQAIDNMAGLDGRTVDGAIDILELAYQSDDGAKKSLSNLVNILKQRGLVVSAASRGPRGRGVGIG